MLPIYIWLKHGPCSEEYSSQKIINETNGDMVAARKQLGHYLYNAL